MMAGILRTASHAKVMEATARSLVDAFSPGASRSSTGSDPGSIPAAPFTGSTFDRLIDGVNRMPRPLLALGTLGFFAYAMAAPDSFASRMRAMAQVPEPLWWLLGAIVSFYFGAREAHYLRARPGSEPSAGSGPAGEPTVNPNPPKTGV